MEQKETIKKKKRTPPRHTQYDVVALGDIINTGELIIKHLDTHAAATTQENLREFLVRCYKNHIFSAQVSSLQHITNPISTADLELISEEIQTELTPKKQRPEILTEALQQSLSVIQAYTLKANEDARPKTPTRPRPSSIPTTPTKDNDKKQTTTDYSILIRELKSSATKPADRNFLTLCAELQLFDWDKIEVTSQRKKIAIVLETTLNKLTSEEIAHTTRGSIMISLSVNLHKLTSGTHERFPGESATKTYVSDLKSTAEKAKAFIQAYSLALVQSNPEPNIHALNIKTINIHNIDITIEHLKSLLNQFLDACSKNNLTENPPPKAPAEKSKFISYLTTLYLNILSKPPIKDSSILTSLSIFVDNIILIYPTLHNFKSYFSEKQLCYRAANTIKSNNESILKALAMLKDNNKAYQRSAEAIKNAWQDCLTNANVQALFKLELEAKTQPTPDKVLTSIDKIKLDTLAKTDTLVVTLCTNIMLLCKRYGDFLLLEKLPPRWACITLNLREHNATLDRCLNEYKPNGSPQKAQEFRNSYAAFHSYCIETLLPQYLKTFGFKSTQADILESLCAISKDTQKLDKYEAFKAFNAELNAIIKLLGSNKYRTMPSSLGSYNSVSRSLSFSSRSPSFPNSPSFPRSPSLYRDHKEQSRTRTVQEILSSRSTTDINSSLINIPILEVITEFKTSIVTSNEKNANILYGFLIQRSIELPNKLASNKDRYLADLLASESSQISSWKNSLDGYLRSIIETNSDNTAAKNLLKQHQKLPSTNTTSSEQQERENEQDVTGVEYEFFF